VELVLVFALGLSIGMLIAILLPISPQVRRETGLPPDEELVALLGEEPPDFHEPPPSPDRHREFDPGELRALRNIGTNQGGGHRRRSKRR
jgi:hypothetical protein